jgi:hypothetical protein
MLRIATLSVALAFTTSAFATEVSPQITDVIRPARQGVAAETKDTVTDAEPTTATPVNGQITDVVKLAEQGAPNGSNNIIADAYPNKVNNQITDVVKLASSMVHHRRTIR